MIELRVTMPEYVRLREAIARAEDAASGFESNVTLSIDLRRIVGAIVGEQIASQMFGCVKVVIQDGPIAERIHEIP